MRALDLDLFPAVVALCVGALCIVGLRLSELLAAKVVAARTQRILAEAAHTGRQAELAPEGTPTTGKGNLHGPPVGMHDSAS